MDYLIMFELMTQMGAMLETFVIKQILTNYCPKDEGEYVKDSEEFLLISFIDTICSCVVIFLYLLLTLFLLCRSFKQRGSEMTRGKKLEKGQQYEADTDYFIVD